MAEEYEKTYRKQKIEKRQKSLQIKKKDVYLNMKTNIEKMVEGQARLDKPKKQKVSATYTLRATGKNVNKLNEMELITMKEAETMLEIIKKAIQKYMEEEIKI